MQVDINNLPSFCLDFKLINFDKSILKAENILIDNIEKNKIINDNKIKNFNLERGSIKYCSNLFKYLNLKKGLKIEDIFSVEKNVFINSIKSWGLSEIELHVRNSKAELIPPHQDQFYHCCNPREKAKIIFSLTNLRDKNGFLEYFKNELPIVSLKNHIASSVPAFSSFIPNDLILNDPERWQKVFIKKHNIVFHYMDSVHRAQVNETKEKCAFLVFRFDKNNYEIPEIKNNYKRVYNLHMKNLKKLN